MKPEMVLLWFVLNVVLLVLCVVAAVAFAVAWMGRGLSVVGEVITAAANWAVDRLAGIGERMGKCRKEPNS